MSRCRKSQVLLDTSTLERLVHDPAGVLADEEGFWESEKPQTHTRLWAEAVGYEIPYDKWRQQVAGLAALSEEERAQHPLLLMVDELSHGKQAFLDKALPHLCSFFPEDTVLDVTVRFTAFVPPYAWGYEDIFFNVAHPHWKGSTRTILNTLVHEIGHVGYGYCRSLHSDPELENKALDRMLVNLHDEGFCTYIGYRARPLFPAPENKDYPMLADPAVVRTKIADLNGVLAKAGRIDDDALRQEIWDVCIAGEGRAYYIAGAHMCRTIDERLGREKLIEVTTAGPLTFVDCYNSLVEEELRCLNSPT